MILFSDRSCPYAHRVLALALHLGIALERREAPVGDTPDGLQGYSAAHSLPLFVEGPLVLSESRVMLEHLAEAVGFVDAWPDDLAARTRHRQAMAVVDGWLAPALFGQRDLSGGRLVDVLDALQAATAAPPVPCLLGFHVAPFWLRYRRWQPTSTVTRAIASRPALCTWLDAQLLLPALRATAPDPSHRAEDLERARAAGLVPSSMA